MAKATESWGVEDVTPTDPNRRMTGIGMGITPDGKGWDMNAITVTVGKESFYPRPGNGFECGPFTFTTHIMAGETPADATKRAHVMLMKLQRKMFEAQMNRYLANEKALRTAIKHE